MCNGHRMMLLAMALPILFEDFVCMPLGLAARPRSRSRWEGHALRERHDQFTIRRRLAGPAVFSLPFSILSEYIYIFLIVC